MRWLSKTALAIFISLILPDPSMGQATIESLQARIDSLNSIKTLYEQKITEVDKSVLDIKFEIAQIESDNRKSLSSQSGQSGNNETRTSDSYETILNKPTSLRSGPSIHSKIIGSFGYGKVAIITGYKNGFVKVTLKKKALVLSVAKKGWVSGTKNVSGYIPDVDINMPPEIEILKAKWTKEQARIKAEQFRIKAEQARIKAVQARVKRAAREARQAKADTERRVQEEKARADRKRALDARRKSLTSKYGARNADRIVNKKTWIGMTAEQAVESWGRPKDINRTTSRSGVREQWVYGSGTNRSYLYFDNGILTTIQN